MAKLILVDNYARENIADVLIEENINENEAKIRAEAYNESNPHSDWFARVVPDSYKLWEGIKEFI